MLPRITLVGYRACGKTTIGRLLAARLAWPFVDADHVLEERLGTTIPEVFRTRGEAAFRTEEEATLAAILAADGPCVLATGGGAILREANRDVLRRRGGLVVYLEASAPVVQERLRHHQGNRPSLTGVGVADEVPALLAQRDPLYRAVAGRIEPTSGSAEAVAGRLAQAAQAAFSLA